MVTVNAHSKYLWTIAFAMKDAVHKIYQKGRKPRPLVFTLKYKYYLN